MESTSQAHAGEQSHASPPTCATPGINFSFFSDHVGFSSIVAGLRSLASCASQTETWVIARPALLHHPECIIAQFTVETGREQANGSPAWVLYCDKGDELDVQRLLPPSLPQDVEYACARLCALLCGLAERHNADILRIKHTTGAAIDRPAIVPLTDVIWYRIAPHERKSKRVTLATVRQRLRREQKLSPATADKLLESHARSTGLIKIGEEWFAATPTFVLPPLSRDDYERILRALLAHAGECNSDRLRHGAIGNYGAARGLAAEEIETRRELELIEHSTAKHP